MLRLQKLCIASVLSSTCLLLLSFQSSDCGPGESRQGEDMVDHIASVTDGPFGNLRDQMEENEVPGVSVAVIDDYQIEWTKAFGFRQESGSDPVTCRTLFPASSITKGITATLVMILSERGLMRLDQGANSLLYTWKLPDSSFTFEKEVSVLNLLDHSGCLNRPDGGFGYEGTYPTTIQILNGERPALNDPLRIDCVPGSEIRYSNFGYIVLQQLIEDVMERSFADLSEELVLKPVGMESSTFEQPLPGTMESRAAFPHDLDGRMMERVYNPHALGQGGLWTNPTDLARFSVELMKALRDDAESMIPSEVARELMTPHHRGLATGAFSGLGFVPFGDWAFLTAGSDPGFRSLLAAFPGQGKGIVVMVNGEGGEILQLLLLGNFVFEYFMRPNLGKILAGVMSAVVLLSALLVWPVAFLWHKLRNRLGSKEVNKEGTALGFRVRLLSGTGVILLLGALYPFVFSILNLVGPFSWSRGTLVIFCVTLVGLGSVISLISLCSAIAVWRRDFWTMKARVYYSLVVLSLLTASLLWVDLLVFLA